MFQLIEIFAVIFLTLALASALYGFITGLTAARLMGAGADRGAMPPPGAVLPIVSILKPLHGAEPELFENLASFLTQDYPGQLQVIFGVASADDPAIEIVNALRAAFPHVDLGLVIDSVQHGRNRKVSNLVNVARVARGDIVILADSDIRVAPTYLSAIVAALGTPGTGAVSCLYRGRPTGSFWSTVSMLGIDIHFLPNAAFAIILGLAKPCFGSTIALSRQTLVRIGGFEPLADQLADDYAVGSAIRALGLSVIFPPMIVDHVCPESTLWELWAHDLRWARTIRAVDPAGYAGTFLTNPVPLAVIGLAFSGFSASAAALCLGVILLRLWHITRLRAAFALSPAPTSAVLIRDMLSFAVYVWSYAGRSVEWRGEALEVAADGRLTRSDSVPGKQVPGR